MKTIKLLITALVLFLLFFAGCMVQIVTTTPATVGAQNFEPSTLQLISIALLGIYEVVVRAVPSVGNYSVVSWLITALKFISDKLNNLK